MPPPEANYPELVVDGAATAYRLFDVGYAIDLEHASALLASSAPARARPERVEAQALHIQNPPVSVGLGSEQLTLAGAERSIRITARLYDFGLCSLHLRVETQPACPWDDFVELGAALDASQEAGQLLERELGRLLTRILPAIDRPETGTISEDYVVFRVARLATVQGEPLGPRALTDRHLVPLLLNERRRLSRAARRELLSRRFSYYADDLAILTWDNALVVEPREHDQDVEFIVEFANAQLLELRLFDALLEAELPAMYDRVSAARRHRVPLPTWRFPPLLAQLQARVADITETVERVDNALKVTDDVYLARIYSSALELFRESTWRRGIERKLAIVRETYAMLNAESQAARAELLEFTIVLLIVGELVIGVMK